MPSVFFFFPFSFFPLYNLSCESLPGCTTSLLALCKNMLTVFGLSLESAPPTVMHNTPGPHTQTLPAWNPLGRRLCALVSAPGQFAPLWTGRAFKKRNKSSFINVWMDEWIDGKPCLFSWGNSSFRTQHPQPTSPEKAHSFSRNGVFTPLFVASCRFSSLSSSVGPPTLTADFARSH